MTIRKKTNKLHLSAEEIIVLAALLKYQSVFAIRDNFLFDFQTDTDQVIHSVINGFEKKGLIFYSLDGELQIEQNLKSVIDMLCKPDYVIVIDGILRKKKRETGYVAGLMDKAVTFGQDGSGGYDLELMEKDEIRDFLQGFLRGNPLSDMHESIDLENMEMLQSHILNFQRDIAIDYLNQKCNDESSVDPIVNFLAKRGEYIRIQIHKKGSILYRNTYNAFFVTHEDRQMKISMDENNIVHFDTLSTEDVVEEMIKAIE